MVMTRSRCAIFGTMLALNASLAHGGEKNSSQAIADVYTAAANSIVSALGGPMPETSPASIAVERLVGCAKIMHYDPSLLDPIIGELSAIPPGTDQMAALMSKLAKFKAKAKATGKKPLNYCIEVQG